MGQILTLDGEQASRCNGECRTTIGGLITPVKSSENGILDMLEVDGQGIQCHRDAGTDRKASKKYYSRTNARETTSLR